MIKRLLPFGMSVGLFTIGFRMTCWALDVQPTLLLQSGISCLFLSLAMLVWLLEEKDR